MEVIKKEKTMKRNYCIDCKHCNIFTAPSMPGCITECKVHYTINLVTGEHYNTSCNGIREEVRDHCPNYQKKVTFFRKLKHLFYLIKFKLL